MSRQGWVGLVTVLAIALMAVLLFSLAEPRTDSDPIPVRNTTPDTEPSEIIGRAERVALPPPSDMERPYRPDNPETNPITPDDKRAMNYAVNDVVIAARDECLLPWLESIEEPARGEFVFDAVLYDGRLYDVSMQSLDLEMPRDVATCIADAAWNTDFPTWDLKGEVRLQRVVNYRNDL